MNRPVTLAADRWPDLSLGELCALTRQMGYDGIELDCEHHLDVRRAARDKEYVKEIQHSLRQEALGIFAVSAEPLIQATGPESWLADEYMAPAASVLDAIRAAVALGTDIVVCSSGVRCIPGRPETGRMFSYAVKNIQRILEISGDDRVRIALTVEPPGFPFDYYTTEKLLDAVPEQVGICFDPAPLEWQGVNPVVFVRNFASRIYSVHLRDVAVRLDGMSGILGSLFESGDTRRGWNYRSPGHGDVNFEDILRELDATGYTASLCVDWDDPGMNPILGATEACEFARQLAFE